VAIDAFAGSVLVVDLDATTRGDRRLLAHLGADEPRENAALVCRHYLQDTSQRRGRCRLVTLADAELAPCSGLVQLDRHAGRPDDGCVDTRGQSYRLRCVSAGTAIAQLRWCRDGHPQAAVSVRDVVAALESYEPVRSLTAGALSHHLHAPDLSTATLRAEFERVNRSPIVLNRRLREVVLGTIELQGLSMSEIAIRCGRVKRDRKGNESGETSWLARRLGLLAEGGVSAPTPWIHSDVLALIARHGLGISPREVELG
jgi:hypothetical protein